jgi:hypothetical protein
LRGARRGAVIAAIAADETDASSRTQVAELPGAGDATSGMVAVLTWGEEIRRQGPKTAPWHFIDILSAPAYSVDLAMS